MGAGVEREIRTYSMQVTGADGPRSREDAERGLGV